MQAKGHIQFHVVRLVIAPCCMSICSVTMCFGLQVWSHPLVYRLGMSLYFSLLQIVATPLRLISESHRIQVVITLMIQCAFFRLRLSQARSEQSPSIPNRWLSSQMLNLSIASSHARHNLCVIADRFLLVMQALVELIYLILQGGLYTCVVCKLPSTSLVQHPTFTG